MSGLPACPCEEFVHPRTVTNPAGLRHVEYRVGDFRTFRRALLQALPHETELGAWSPNSRGDLLLQVLEWWAYVSDVLTFYNERSLNENLLATADLDESVRRLVRVLGYRPRPGIGGTARLGVLVASPRPIVLPAGFRVESKPPPGKRPQTFETTEEVLLDPADVVPAHPVPSLSGGTGNLFLSGQVKDIVAGDYLLLSAMDGTEPTRLLRVRLTRFGADAASPYTELILEGAPNLPTRDATQYVLRKSLKSVGVYPYPTQINVILSPIDLESIERSVAPNQPMLLTAYGAGLDPVLLMANATREVVYYANGDGPSPPPPPSVPIGVPHTQVYWSSSEGVDIVRWNSMKSKVRVLIDWAVVADLRNAPANAYQGDVDLLADRQGAFAIGNRRPSLVEDAIGDGLSVRGTVSESNPGRLKVSEVEGAPLPRLKTPVRVLQNVVTLTRGKTVPREVLGRGDASAKSQEFTLQKSPLTYLPAGDGYRSTLRVYVDGVEWTEVPSFYGQPPDARVFVTREDDSQKTHVQFGDWSNGAGLPTGAEVTAFYRIESGAEDVAPGGLTVVSRPVPGVRAVRQPVLAGGGADPDPREQIRRFAPRSVLTFGRAIAADDYEAIAARAPGVTRARTFYTWNAESQRALVTVYVGDTAKAKENVLAALRGAADPNRPFTVELAREVRVGLVLAVRLEPGRLWDDVAPRVVAALADPENGLFGVRTTRIGESVYFSQISDACHRVPGVQSVTSLRVILSREDPGGHSAAVGGVYEGTPPRLNAAEDEYFVLDPAKIELSEERWNRG